MLRVFEYINTQKQYSQFKKKYSTTIHNLMVIQMQCVLS